jgi:hypothetical protein
MVNKSLFLPNHPFGECISSASRRLEVYRSTGKKIYIIFIYPTLNLGCWVAASNCHIGQGGRALPPNGRAAGGQRAGARTRIIAQKVFCSRLIHHGTSIARDADVSSHISLESKLMYHNPTIACSRNPHSI